MEAALPVLLAASDAFRVEGDELLHLDVCSDNVCFRADGSAVLVDWNLAAIGNDGLDVAFWLRSLAAEGGPMPEAVLPHAPHEAAFVSGFFAARAGKPPIPGLPAIRPMQFEQLRHALPWACGELALPLRRICANHELRLIIVTNNKEVVFRCREEAHRELEAVADRDDRARC